MCRQSARDRATPLRDVRPRAGSRAARRRGARTHRAPGPRQTTRRSNMARSASGSGASCSSSSRISTKASSGSRTQLRSRKAGSAGRSGATKAQCLRYSAPPSIQRRRIARSPSVSGRLSDGGGITSSGSCESMRWAIALAARSPGTIARSPDFRAAYAPSAVSSRRPALRLLASGP